MRAPFNKNETIDFVIVGSGAAGGTIAKELATAGDVVLLSPTCARNDMFEEFQQGGLQFAKLLK